jgi:hypothetical protein
LQEQSPEQSPLPFVVASPQPRSSDDDAMDLEPSNADNICCKLKEAWEKTYPSETSPDEHIPVSNDNTSGRYTLVKTNLKCGFVANHPTSYQLISKGYFTKLEQCSIMIQSLEKY